MFRQKTPSESTGLQSNIDNLELQLLSLDPTSDNYVKMMDQLVKLYTLKTNLSSKPVSKDTLALIGANLAGIGLILSYEHAHVVTSKALSFVSKLR